MLFVLHKYMNFYDFTSMVGCLKQKNEEEKL